MWTQRLAAAFRSTSIAKHRWRIWRKSSQRNWKSPKIGYVYCIAKSKHQFSIYFVSLFTASSMCVCVCEWLVRIAEYGSIHTMRNFEIEMESKDKGFRLFLSPAFAAKRLNSIQMESNREREILLIWRGSGFHLLSHTQAHARIDSYTLESCASCAACTVWKVKRQMKNMRLRSIRMVASTWSHRNYAYRVDCRTSLSHRRYREFLIHQLINRNRTKNRQLHAEWRHLISVLITF